MKSVTSEKNSAEKVSTVVLGQDEIGSVKIHENVVAQLARRAALEVEGISRLAGSALVDDIASLVGSRRMQSRAVSVVLGDEGNVDIEIKVVLEFGYCIPDVASKAQAKIIELVESTTGMSVSKVDILVQEIDEPEPEESEVTDTPELVTTLPLN